VSDVLKLVYRRALASADPSLVQLSFDASVIDRYREQGDFQVIRTNTAGRVRKPGGWSIDFGIAGQDRVVHCSWQALVNALPEREREHWAMHAVAAGELSDNFLKMQMSPGSCFDDGDTRSWQ
jgi:hypothetical protein